MAGILTVTTAGLAGWQAHAAPLKDRDNPQQLAADIAGLHSDLLPDHPRRHGTSPFSSAPDSHSPHQTPPPATETAPSPAPSSSPKPPAAPPAPSLAPSASWETSQANAVIQAVNNERGKQGCAMLTVDTRLMRAAASHSTDMISRHYFDHTTPDGTTPADRARANGYSAGVGENIAEGYSDEQAAMGAWMNSAGHRANIQNCSYHSTGVGVSRASDGTPYWTQEFGLA